MKKFGKIPKVKDWNDAVKGFYNIVMTDPVLMISPGMICR